jgi:cellobiose phosphorylase
MYRLLLESLLGLQRRGNRLRLATCIQGDWQGYRIEKRIASTLYRIEVRSCDAGAPALSLDGVAQSGEDIELRDDGGVHAVVLDWPRAPA